MNGGRFGKNSIPCNKGVSIRDLRYDNYRKYAMSEGKCICKSKSECNNTGIRLFIIFIILVAFLRLFIPHTSLFFRYIKPLPFSLHLSEQDLVLKKGEMHSLYIKGLNKRVKYSSTDFRIAGVNLTGRVFAYQPGTAFIIAKVDNKELKCRVRVIDINKDKLNMSIGNSYKLKVLGPAKFVRWKSSDEKVATVSSFGKVKAKGKGKTLITATWKGKKLECDILVK